MFVIINGLRIKAGVAPTSFMVCIRNRLEYALKRIVLLISAKEIIISIPASRSRIAPIRFTFSFTNCIKSFR